MTLRIGRTAYSLLAGIGLSLSTISSVYATPPGTNDNVIVLPVPSGRSISDRAVVPVAVEAVPPASLGVSVPVVQEPCPLYFRNRPHGCKKEKREIMFHNRVGEPEWYRYYRCQHFGYHPTIWTPWPDNWLTCRPAPGKHPYDLMQPGDLPQELEEGRRLRVTPPRNSTQEAPPLRPDDLQEPKKLPQDENPGGTP